MLIYIYIYIYIFIHIYMYIGLYTSSNTSPTKQTSRSTASIDSEKKYPPQRTASMEETEVCQNILDILLVNITNARMQNLITSQHLHQYIHSYHSFSYIDHNFNNINKSN
jgi:hypothetical protein